MKHLFFNLSFYLIFWMSIGLLSAQEPADTSDFFSVEDETIAIASYDLQGCISYAIRNQESVKLAQMNVRTAQAEVGEKLSTGLPQIDASANFQDNFKIQRSFVPAFLFDNTAPEGLFIPVQFQPKYSGNAVVQLEQLIFDFSYLLGVRAAREYVDLQQTQVQFSKVDIKAAVSKAYYGVLVSRERIGLIDQNYQRLDTLLRETRALYQNGFAELLEVQRIEVAYNNIMVERQKAYGTVTLAKQILQYQMGMPVRDSLILSGSIKEIELSSNDYAGSISNPKSRIEYQLFEKQKSLQEINFKYQKSLYYPRLSGVVAYGSNTGVNSFGDFWNFNQNWFGFGYYGINLRIPIFDGFKRKHTFAKTQIELDKIYLQMSQFERSTDFQVAQAQTNFAQSVLTLQNQQRNMELAKEVTRVTKIKYQNGVGSNLEVVNAEADYKEAETNYFATLYEALIRKIDLDRALGNFDN
jgi:outer membrane protein TolC